MNASQQIGGYLGIALFSTIAASATASAAGTSLEALTTGYSAVFLWAGILAILTTPTALLLITISRKTFTGAPSDDATPVHLG